MAKIKKWWLKSEICTDMNISYKEFDRVMVMQGILENVEISRGWSKGKWRIKRSLAITCTRGVEEFVHKWKGTNRQGSYKYHYENVKPLLEMWAVKNKDINEERIKEQRYGV